MKKIYSLLLSVVLLLMCACSVGANGDAAETFAPVTATPAPTATAEPTPEPTATPTPTPEPPAEELTAQLTVYDDIGGAISLLLDGDKTTRIGYRNGNVLTVECAEPMEGLYLSWYEPTVPYTVQTESETISCGEWEFLHEYIAFAVPTCMAEIHFAGYAPLCELKAFGSGALPENVQCWLPPAETADVLVMATHADDDVIFFGAMVADCIDRGLTVQIAYLVNHYDWQPRPQELLDALWALGVRNYPVIGPFPDYYVLSLQEAIGSFGEDAVKEYQTELIRRFRPLIIIGHDRNGEYGHGAHMINARMLEQSVLLSGDENAFPASAEQYGTWEAPKLYLHLAEENPMLLDVDIPLDSYGGRTAFEVANEAMLYHESQLIYDHRPQRDNPDYPEYDCRRFGLVYTLVGVDTEEDILQHVQRSANGWVTVQ